MGVAFKDGIGSNSEGIHVEIEVRLFNSLSRYRAGSNVLPLPAGSTVGDLIDLYGIPEKEIFLVLCNGRDVSPGLYGKINPHRALNDGDVIAFSGPVPYSYGYGAPVV